MLPNTIYGEFPLTPVGRTLFFTGTYSDGFFENSENFLFGNSPIKSPGLKVFELF